MDILIDLGAARDQGTRPTCMSFALSDVHRAVINFSEHLSPESLHRAAAARAKTPVEEAITDAGSLEALEADGQTTEATWPYNSAICIDQNAIFHKRAGCCEDFHIDIVTRALQSGCPVVIVLEIGEEFFRCVSDKPLEAADARPAEACHAVVINGSRSSDAQHHFRIKNSWGTGWGSNGYAWVSAKYLAQRSRSIVRVY